MPEISRAISSLKEGDVRKYVKMRKPAEHSVAEELVSNGKIVEHCILLGETWTKATSTSDINMQFNSFFLPSK